METNGPVVGILMGSDSDLPIMKEASSICEQFGVKCEIKIISAHRTPQILADYASSAADRGLKVIIAGAGGAAHLPGVTAAFTPLPVIGVPILGKSTNGMDSLLSIVQMPSGVPVATVAINGAKNAGILAMQILGASDTEIRNKVIAFKHKLAEESQAKNNALI
ncbi:MAG: 5-(carboxyamino)imidazole ribonucleotide mutase [Bacteroidota bacterium]|nr:5-(carboxyamino)imidazole ribonucleotide mutase [Bacteroidota bacterium]MDP4192819.1 5-(carboxyamino)imidazole ribonucleotide mutase [Bacteroidota bacterium]MDP4196100.1 5-(carboxyamino)imidazole ribonucleotide mutase [Bacteroidota bacterium]